MKMYNNDTVYDNSNIPDRRSPMSQRIHALVIVAIPSVNIVLGLFIDKFFASANNNLAYLVLVIPAVLVALNRLLLKNSSSRLLIASRWMMKSHEESIEGLDERERQVIDQAYRMSYRILALACWLILAIVFTNVYTWHLTYQFGQIGIVFIILGIIDLLSFLPTAIVVWNEGL